MKHEFIWNADGDTLVNVSYIRRVKIRTSSVKYENRQGQVTRVELTEPCHVYAEIDGLSGGTEILYSGQYEDCFAFVHSFYCDHELIEETPPAYQITPIPRG